MIGGALVVFSWCGKHCQIDIWYAADHCEFLQVEETTPATSMCLAMVCERLLQLFFDNIDSSSGCESLRAAMDGMEAEGDGNASVRLETLMNPRRPNRTSHGRPSDSADLGGRR